MANLLLSGWLPDETKQGITNLYDGQVAQAVKRKKADIVYAVVALRRHTIKLTEDADQDPQVTMRIVAAEPIVGDDEKVVRDLLDRHCEARTGDTMLPMEAPN